MLISANFITALRAIKSIQMNNNKLLSRFLLVIALAATLTSCEAIAGIFKAGVWVGVLIVVGIIGLIIFIISRAGGKN